MLNSAYKKRWKWICSQSFQQLNFCGSAHGAKKYNWCDDEEEMDNDEIRKQDSFTETSPPPVSLIHYKWWMSSFDLRLSGEFLLISISKINWTNGDSEAGWNVFNKNQKVSNYTLENLPPIQLCSSQSTSIQASQSHKSIWRFQSQGVVRSQKVSAGWVKHCLWDWLIAKMDE